MLIGHNQTFHIVYFLAFYVIPIVSTVLLTHDTHRIVNSVLGVVGYGYCPAGVFPSSSPLFFRPLPSCLSGFLIDFAAI